MTLVAERFEPHKTHSADWKKNLTMLLGWMRKQHIYRYTFKYKYYHLQGKSADEVSPASTFLVPRQLSVGYRNRLTDTSVRNILRIYHFKSHCFIIGSIAVTTTFLRIRDTFISRRCGNGMPGGRASLSRAMYAGLYTVILLIELARIWCFPPSVFHRVASFQQKRNEVWRENSKLRCDTAAAPWTPRREAYIDRFETR